MAVLLGFVDDLITENHADKVDYKTNKLGGLPNWIETTTEEIKVNCPVCGSTVPLLLQIYAPVVERYEFHRTLYIFACVNPNCYGNSNSWMCLKRQILAEENIPKLEPQFPTDEWVPNSNNWNDNDESSTSQSFLLNEATSLMGQACIEEKNANELLCELVTDFKNEPTAEIEPDENEPITLDSPIIPLRNVANLLDRKPSKVLKATSHFIPYFVNAFDETCEKDTLTEHALNLLAEYSHHNKNDLKIPNNVNAFRQSDEKYEKCQPAHGDKLFHVFMSRIKMNPEQILRYCRNDKAPLFLYPESNIPKCCKSCGGDMIFEMQILPSIINYLRFPRDNQTVKDSLDFGSAFIYTCKLSCDKSTQECVIVQLEKV